MAHEAHATFPQRSQDGRHLLQVGVEPGTMGKRCRGVEYCMWSVPENKERRLCLAVDLTHCAVACRRDMKTYRGGRRGGYQGRRTLPCAWDPAAAATDKEAHWTLVETTGTNCRACRIGCNRCGSQKKADAANGAEADIRRMHADARAGRSRARGRASFKGRQGGAPDVALRRRGHRRARQRGLWRWVASRPRRRRRLASLGP